MTFDWHITVGHLLLGISALTALITYLVTTRERTTTLGSAMKQMNEALKQLTIAMNRVTTLEEQVHRHEVQLDRFAKEAEEIPRALLLGRLDDLRMELRQHMNDDRDIQTRISDDLRALRTGESEFYQKMEEFLRSLKAVEE